MEERYLLGVDIGTYESKGVLVTLAGDVVATAVRPHELLLPRQGWAEHDAERAWWGDFCTITRELLETSRIAPERIAAVGCSAIGPVMLPVDEACRPLRNAVLYGIDTRAVEEIRELDVRMGAETIFARTGNALSSQSVGPKILWLRKHEPECYAKAAKIVAATTFLCARLTGRWMLDHYSASCFVPLYDMTAGTWGKDLCEGIIEPERLPDIAWTSEIAGTITPEAEAATGLAKGTPVIVGTIDAAAEAVSAGVTAPGQAMLMYGSTMFYIQVVNRPVRDRRLWSAPYLFPGTSAIMAGMATTGVLTRWFRDMLARELVEAEAKGGESAYSRLAALAAAVPPGAEGLVVLPYFSGERTPLNDPRARGVFFGLTLSHTREHLYRAVLEGVGHGIRHHLDVLDEIGAAPLEVRAVGGGTKNRPWLQMVSDISGRAQLVPAVTLGASYGDAFLAGLGTGLFASYSDISRWVRRLETVAPDHAPKPLYDRAHRIYRDLYERTKDLMHDLTQEA